MAKLSDLKRKYRIFMQTYLYRQYAWHPGAVLVPKDNFARILTQVAAEKSTAHMMRRNRASGAPRWPHHCDVLLTAALRDVYYTG
jgi:hypothetical protein